MSMNVDKHIVKWSGVGALALLSLGSLLLVGCNRGDSTATDNSTTSPTTSFNSSKDVAGGPPPTRPGPNGLGGPGRGGPGATGGNDPFALRGGAPGAPGGKSKGTQVAMAPHYSQDPFLITWKNPPPPPYVFDEVQPLRVASAVVKIEPPQPVHVREVADRRVSGIMSGDGVYAIIEQGGVSEVVKPGSTTTDGYRVVSINGDSVKLERRDGNIIRTQTVELSDAQTGPQTAGYGGMSGGGYPGMSGYPGSGGYPGFPGRPGVGGGGNAGGGKSSD